MADAPIPHVGVLRCRAQGAPTVQAGAGVTSSPTQRSSNTSTRKEGRAYHPPDVALYVHRSCVDLEDLAAGVQVRKPKLHLQHSTAQHSVWAAAQHNEGPAKAPAADQCRAGTAQQRQHSRQGSCPGRRMWDTSPSPGQVCPACSGNRQHLMTSTLPRPSKAQPHLSASSMLSLLSLPCDRGGQGAAGRGPACQAG